MGRLAHGAPWEPHSLTAFQTDPFQLVKSPDREALGDDLRRAAEIEEALGIAPDRP